MRSQSGTVRVHLFVPDATPAHHGKPRCRDCLLPKNNRAHKVPERTDEQRADDARRLGERH